MKSERSVYRKIFDKGVEFGFCLGVVAGGTLGFILAAIIF